MADTKGKPLVINGMTVTSDQIKVVYRSCDADDAEFVMALPGGGRFTIGDADIGRLEPLNEKAREQVSRARIAWQRARDQRP